MSLVSIVIPCYKGARYLPLAIESCLKQTHRDVEVILVDDASPENDAEIGERYAREDSRVRVLRHEKNGGVSRAFNTGFNAARGDFFTRLAQDDLFREDAIEFMLKRFSTDPDLGFVYCDMQLIDSDGKFMHMLPTEEPQRALMPRHRVGVCVLWRRIVWETVGPFDPLYDTSDDYEFFLRISRSFKLGKCYGEAPFFFRYHPTQGGVKRSKQQDYTYALSQRTHHLALVKQHPLRLGIWRKVMFDTFRVWHRKRLWKKSEEWQKSNRTIAN